MSKSATIDQITLCADGSIGVRWLKQISDPDTDEVLFSEPHRFVVDFDGDIDLQIDSVVSQLQDKGYTVEKAKQLALIKQIDAIGKANADITAAREAKTAIKSALALSADEIIEINGK